MTLTETELDEIIVDENFVLEENKKSLNSLVGKLFSERIVSKKVLRNTMMKVWKTSKPFIFIDICSNIFIVKFDNLNDKTRVLQDKLWLFDFVIFSLRKFEGRVQLAKMDFNKEVFWV